MNLLRQVKERVLRDLRSRQFSGASKKKHLRNSATTTMDLIAWSIV